MQAAVPRRPCANPIRLFRSTTLLEAGPGHSAITVFTTATLPRMAAE